MAAIAKHSDANGVHTPLKAAVHFGDNDELEFRSSSPQASVNRPDGGILRNVADVDSIAINLPLQMDDEDIDDEEQAPSPVESPSPVKSP